MAMAMKVVNLVLPCVVSVAVDYPTIWDAQGNYVLDHHLQTSASIMVHLVSLSLPQHNA
jgi:hypothetical protein